jgi:divalent metal cation (Fe/Co/Zn/Cd) transporter
MSAFRDPAARALATGVVFGAAAVALDVAAVLASNSAALRADLVRGGADTAASLFALLIYLCAPGEQSRRWEDASCSLTAFAILAGIGCMMGMLVGRLANPVVITGTILGFGVALLNLLCNLWLLIANRAARQRGHSALIEAQARVIRLKLLANFSLLATISGATFAPGATAQFASDCAGVVTQSTFGLVTATHLLRQHGAGLLQAVRHRGDII